jgi:hypothetical protein
VDSELSGERSLWPLAAHAVLGAVALFLVIRRYGETLTAPAPPAPPPRSTCRATGAGRNAARPARSAVVGSGASSGASWQASASRRSSAK